MHFWSLWRQDRKVNWLKLKLILRISESLQVAGEVPTLLRLGGWRQEMRTCGVAIVVGCGLWIQSEQSDSCWKNMLRHVSEQSYGSETDDGDLGFWSDLRLMWPKTNMASRFVKIAQTVFSVENIFSLSILTAFSWMCSPHTISQGMLKIY